MPDAGENKFVFRSVSLSHPNTVTETDLVEHEGITERDTHHLDFTNLSQVNETTIRVYEKIDGINYRQLSQKIFPTEYETGTEAVIVVLDGAGQDMKITLESSVAEGSAKTIPGTVRDEVRA